MGRLFRPSVAWARVVTPPKRSASSSVAVGQLSARPLTARNGRSPPAAARGVLAGVRGATLRGCGPGCSPSRYSSRWCSMPPRRPARQANRRSRATPAPSPGRVRSRCAARGAGRSSPRTPSRASISRLRRRTAPVIAVSTFERSPTPSCSRLTMALCTSPGWWRTGRCSRSTTEEACSRASSR